MVALELSWRNPLCATQKQSPRASRWQALVLWPAAPLFSKKSIDGGMIVQRERESVERRETAEVLAGRDGWWFPLHLYVDCYAVIANILQWQAEMSGCRFLVTPAITWIYKSVGHIGSPHAPLRLTFGQG